MTEQTLFLQKYFNEKKIENTIFSIEHEDKTHIIELKPFIDIILSATPIEQKVIAKVIQDIERNNGEISEYLHYLARSYVINKCSENAS